MRSQGLFNKDEVMNGDNKKMFEVQNRGIKYWSLDQFYF